MSSATPVASSSSIFHDPYSEADQDAHQSLHDLLGAESIPARWSGLPGTVIGVEAFKEGHLSKAKLAGGGHLLFGACKSGEGACGCSGNAGEVKFYVDPADEQAVLAQLKAAQLIPDDVNSLEDLGGQGIGVVENSVDEGVLKVQGDGKLVVGEEVDESGSASQGAGQVSSGNADGTRTTADNQNAVPKNARTPSGTEAEEGKLSSEEPAKAGDVSEVTTAETADGKYTVEKTSDASGFVVKQGDDAEYEVNGPSMDAMGFSSDTPVADVAQAFDDGLLGIVNNEVRVVKAAIPGKEGWTVAGDENAGYKILDENNNQVANITPEEAASMLQDGNNAHTLAEQIYNSDSIIVNGSLEAGEAAVVQAEDGPHKIAKKRDGSGFTVQQNGGPPIDVNQGTMDAMGFNQDTPVSDIAKAFEEGRLGVVNDETRVIKADVGHDKGWTVEGNENDGYKVFDQNGKMVGSLSNQDAAALNLQHGNNAYTIASYIGTTNANFIDGDLVPTAESVEVDSEPVEPNGAEKSEERDEPISGS